MNKAYKIPEYSILEMLTGGRKAKQVLAQACEDANKSIAETKKYIIEPSAMHFVSKGWGFEHWIWNEAIANYCGKILYVVASKKTSYHYHNIKDEVLYVVSGKCLISFDEGDDLEKASQVVLTAGTAFHIPPKLRHEIKGIENTRIMEFSTFHEDSDSIRVIKGD